MSYRTIYQRYILLLLLLLLLLNIPDLQQAYRTAVDRDPFLAYDSGVGDEEWFFIFASQDALQLLLDSEHWYTDSTFKVGPKMFFQSYTMHGQCEGTLFCVYTHFCQIKMKTLYNRQFEQLF